MRARWAELQNRALERAHVIERVDHRTLAVQREEALALGHEARAENLDRAPEVKLGPIVSGIERREERAAEREGREYVPLTERGAQVHEARQARSLLAELGRVRDALREEVRQRAELARETYVQARDEGADRISAGLVALRAAAQRQGIGHGEGHGHGREQSLDAWQEREAREAARDAIRERLASWREPGPERAHGTRGAGAGAIEEGLARLTGRGTDRDEERKREAERQREEQRPGHGLEEVRERLGRILEQETQRAHEGIRERLSEALGRAKPTAREREAHEREAQRHGQRAHGHDDGWGL